VASPGSSRLDGDAADHGLASLYGWVQRTREGVVSYLAGVPADVAGTRHPAFRGSMLGLLMHAGDCYLYWIRHAGVGRAHEVVRSGEPRDLDAVRAHFRSADEAVAEVLARRAVDLDVPFEWHGERFTWRWQVMHPVTHEFHHMGQVASLGRILGYPVPERTDLDLVMPD